MAERGRKAKEEKITTKVWGVISRFQLKVEQAMSVEGFTTKKAFAEALGITAGMIEDALKTDIKKWCMTWPTYELICDHFGWDRDKEIPNYKLYLNNRRKVEKESAPTTETLFDYSPQEEKKSNLLSGDVAEEVILELIDATGKYTEEVMALADKYRELISRLESLFPAIETLMMKFDGFDERLIDIEVVMDALSYYSSHSRRNEKGEA